MNDTPTQDEGNDGTNSFYSVVAGAALGITFLAGMFVQSLIHGDGAHVAPAPYTIPTPTCRVESQSVSQPYDGGTAWQSSTLYFGKCRILGDE